MDTPKEKQSITNADVGRLDDLLSLNEDRPSSRPLVQVDPKRTNVVTIRRFAMPPEGGYNMPGEWNLIDGGKHLVLACPGCGWTAAMRVGDPKPSDSPSWAFFTQDGALTLHPSVNCEGCCGWCKYGLPILQLFHQTRSAGKHP